MRPTINPVHPAGPAENAKNAFPTGPWTARTARRPQAAQALLRRFFEKKGGEKHDSKSGQLTCYKNRPFSLAIDSRIRRSVRAHRDDPSSGTEDALFEQVRDGAAS